MKKRSPNFIVFDIGSSKIVAIAANINKQGKTNIGSQILQYSEGFDSGHIVNMERAENSIVRAIYALEQKCDKSINEVTISLSGVGVKSYYMNNKILLNNQVISKQDVKKLIKKTLSEFKVKDQEIVHYFPIEFIVNGNRSVENPVGLYANELSCQLHIISADSMMLMNLTKCLAKCHVEVNDIIVSAYASAISCLNEDEKELGCVVIDIGSNTTSFGIFVNNKIIYVDHVPVGSMHITKDIAKAFSIGLGLADKLKILYGHANPSLLIKDAIIKLDNLDSENNRPDISITEMQVAKIINSRIKGVLIDIKKKCHNISMNHLVTSVVITGGGGSLPGIKSIASEIFQKQVRVAKPKNISKIPENYNPYIYSTALGMIESKSLQYRQNCFKSDRCESNGWLKNMFLWFKENV